MNSDVASVTGTSHRICEDYGRANNDNVPFVVIADGCSGSEDSDFGARLLVKQVENRFLSENWANSSIQHAYISAKDLQLQTECLDATLLAISVDPVLNVISAHIYGDGAIAYKLSNGTIHVNIFEYPSGYPNYLSYSLPVNKDRNDKLQEVYSQEKKHIVTSFIISANGEINEYKETAVIDSRQLHFDKSDIQVFAVMSDGVSSFMRKNEAGVLENVPAAKVIQKLMDFKSYKGEFVQRSLNSLIKESTKQGWYNIDDVTIGAIYFGV